MTGGALDDISLLAPTISMALSSSNEIEETLLAELETSSASGLINQLRQVRLHRCILAIGAFSLFESLMQEKTGLEKPLAYLRDELKTRGEHDLLHTFESYRLAVNVLKHGRGLSYDALCKMPGTLDFRIRLPDMAFFEEGDVAEGETLIEVDNGFVERCTKILEAVLSVLLENEKIETDGKSRRTI